MLSNYLQTHLVECHLKYICNADVFSWLTEELRLTLWIWTVHKKRYFLIRRHRIEFIYCNLHASHSIFSTVFCSTDHNFAQFFSIWFLCRLRRRWSSSARGQSLMQFFSWLSTWLMSAVRLLSVPLKYPYVMGTRSCHVALPASKYQVWSTCTIVTTFVFLMFLLSNRF